MTLYAITSAIAFYTNDIYIYNHQYSVVLHIEVYVLCEDILENILTLTLNIVGKPDQVILVADVQAPCTAKSS